jgi:VIT1/CCC1 family predicted Fe2+/Mn2+ transporter
MSNVECRSEEVPFLLPRCLVAIFVFLSFCLFVFMPLCLYAFMPLRLYAFVPLCLVAFVPRCLVAFQESRFDHNHTSN